MTIPSNVEVFLYLLMRDHLPFGVVNGLVESVVESMDDVQVLSDPGGAAIARRLADELGSDHVIDRTVTH